LRAQAQGSSKVDMMDVDPVNIFDDGESSMDVEVRVYV
jgi:hypothetical protein